MKNAIAIAAGLASIAAAIAWTGRNGADIAVQRLVFKDEAGVTRLILGRHTEVVDAEGSPEPLGPFGLFTYDQAGKLTSMQGQGKDGAGLYVVGDGKLRAMIQVTKPEVQRMTSLVIWDEAGKQGVALAAFKLPELESNMISILSQGRPAVLLTGASQNGNHIASNGLFHRNGNVAKASGFVTIDNGQAGPVGNNIFDEAIDFVKKFNWLRGMRK